MVQIHYSHRTDGPSLVHFEVETDRFDEACAIIDRYPWKKELTLFEELGEGGGFDFQLGDSQGKYARYQFTPIEEGKGFLDLSIVAKTGVFNLLGRQSLSRQFHLVTIETAKTHIQELFEHSVEFLYDKHCLYRGSLA